MGKDVIIACDFAEKTEVLDFLSAFTDRKPFIKIGMELFYAEGADIVRELKRRGHKIFLDLKLHDIPNTVKKTMRVLSALDIDMCNVHAGGTIAMMQAAALLMLLKLCAKRGRRCSALSVFLHTECKNQLTGLQMQKLKTSALLISILLFMLRQKKTSLNPGTLQGLLLFAITRQIFHG